MADRRRQPNQLLRQARGAMTQAQLAEQANAEVCRRTGREGSLTAKSISDLERGWYTWPAKPTRDALCAVLEAADPRKLGFSPRYRRRADVPVWQPPTEFTDRIDRRPGDLAEIRAVSASLQAADRQMGGGHLYPAVVSYLRVQIAPHLASADDDATSSYLFAAAASFSEIAGWMSHDGGHDRRAERHFTQALRMARAADHDGVAANIRASMSHLAVHLGRYDEAVQLADSGTTTIRGHRPQRLGARLLAMRARGLTGLGDSHACRSALADAERMLDRSSGEPEAEWISNFDAAALASESAWCLHRLGELSAAERLARAAIGLRDRGRVRSRSFAQLALAQILLASGSVDEAATLGDQVRATASTMTSARVRAQLVDLATALLPYRDNETVTSFLEPMANMTAAPTLVGEST